MAAANQDDAETVMTSPPTDPSPRSASNGDPGVAPPPQPWTFVDALSDGVYGIDTGGHCTFVNKAALRLLGYDRAEDLVGLHMHRAIHHTRSDGSPFPADACPLLHTTSSGRPVRLDNELLWRRDGTPFVAEYSSYPIFGADGAVTGGVITFTALSAAAAVGVEPGRAVEALWGSAAGRQADDALRASERRFRTMADSISQLAWMTGPDGSIDWYNRRWYEYTGTTLAEMQGWGWKAVQHPDHVERVVERVSAAFAEGAIWEDTFPLRGKDGTYRWFLSRAVPIRDVPDADDPRGQILGWFGTNTDITELREGEEKLAAARDEAEEANRAKSTFIANMSHELRTPLSAIIGYSEMLQEEIADGGDAATLAVDMRKIETNARHLLGLINDVLDLSKIESGKMETFVETIEVEGVVNDVASTVQGLVARNANSLVLRLEPGLGTMRTDVTKLRQILLNLLSNASKFTESGSIILSAMRVPGERGDDWMVFRVADNGIGMDEEQLGRLFQRFSQADASTTRKYGGTGLGLSISKAFGMMLGGDLSVESAPGEGTTFTVFLPTVFRDVPDEGVAEAMTAAPSESDANGRTDRTNTLPVALVIDDDAAQRDLMSRFLAREGFAAVMAPDGKSGLDLARQVCPSVILLDVTMPGLDGWSVLSALKADPALSGVPVVMVTFLDERGLATALGAADYVMKPVVWDRFRQVMERFRERDGSVLVIDDDADTRHHVRSVLERDRWSVVEACDGRDALDRVAEALPRVVLLDLEMPVLDGFGFLQAFRALPGCAAIPVVVLTARDLTRDDRRRLQGASEVLNKGVTSLGALSKELRLVTRRSDIKDAP